MNRRELFTFGGAIILASSWRTPGQTLEMRMLTGLQRCEMSPKERSQWRLVPEQKFPLNVDAAIYVREVWPS